MKSILTVAPVTVVEERVSLKVPFRFSAEATSELSNHWLSEYTKPECVSSK